jgi:sugar phosphate isomerase/epimerase
MYVAMSPVSVSQCSFEEAFEVTATAGFSGIGLRYDRLRSYLAEGKTIGDVKRLAARYGLKFAEAAFLAEWQYHGGTPVISKRQRVGDDSENRDRLMSELNVFLQRCEELGCSNVTTVPALRETGDLDVAAEEFAALCDIAAPYGVRLCLEFMGSATQIRDLKSASNLVTKAGRHNGGVVIDTFLFYQGGSALSDLNEIPIDRVFNVQLAGAKRKPLSELNMLEDRLFPDEGAAPVADIVSILTSRGYDGWWTVELFNPEFARLDPSFVASRALSAAKSVLNQRSTTQLA